MREINLRHYRDLAYKTYQKGIDKEMPNKYTCELRSSLCLMSFFKPWHWHSQSAILIIDAYEVILGD